MQCSCQNRWSYRLLLFNPGDVKLPRVENTSVLKLISLLLPLLPSFLASLMSTAFSSSPPLFLTSSSLHQKSTSSASSEASETCQSVSECNSPTAVSTACLIPLSDTHSQTRTHRHTGCCTIHLLYSVVERGPWVVLDSRSAGWCGLVMDVEHSDSDLSVRSAVWLMLILRYLSPCFLSHWLHHQASLCHTSCVPHI